MKTSVIKLKVILNNDTEIEGIGFYNYFEYQSYFFDKFNRKDVKIVEQISYFGKLDIDFDINKTINTIKFNIEKGYDYNEIYKLFGL